MFLQSFDNATLYLNTPAIQTQVQCVSGSVTLSNGQNTTKDSSPAVTMTATLGSGATGGYNSSCTFEVDIDTPSVNWQSGATTVQPSCNQYITTGSKSGLPTDDLAVDFRSVAFWAYSWDAKSGAAIFCTPQITANNVLVKTNVTTNTIWNITSTGTYSPGNNVTGSPLNGQAYNG